MSIKEDVIEMKKSVNEMKKQSLAWEIIEVNKKQNKRLFVTLLLVLCMWFATIGYLVYVLNDKTEYESIEIEDVETIDNTHIKIGDDIWEKSK